LKGHWIVPVLASILIVGIMDSEISVYATDFPVLLPPSCVVGAPVDVFMVVGDSVTFDYPVGPVVTP